MSLEVGKEAMCIIGHDQDTRLKKGSTYKVLGLSSPNCKCKVLMVDIGLSAIGASGKRIRMGQKLRCTNCNIIFMSDGRQWFTENHFAPIDSVDISELEEVLDEQIFKV